MPIRRCLALAACLLLAAVAPVGHAAAAETAPVDGPSAAAPDETASDVETDEAAPPSDDALAAAVESAPLEGPLRPKGTLPPRPERPEDPGWQRKFGPGVNWTRVDTTLSVTGKRDAVRFGVTLAR